MSDARPRGAWLLAGLALVLAAAFSALSAWQWQRVAWKQGLIERATTRSTAAAQALPAPATWPALRREDIEYQRVTLSGRLDPSRERLVLASTGLGRGHWVLQPLLLADGHWVWINRGFIDHAHREPSSRATHPAEITLTGLLRWTEPSGWLWQRNDAGDGASGRWVSRELPALSASARLPVTQVAPFFVDEAAVPADAGSAERFPRPGLTVLQFSNNHLVYALTWMALALGCLAGAVLAWRHRMPPPTKLPTPPPDL